MHGEEETHAVRLCGAARGGAMRGTGRGARITSRRTWGIVIQTLITILTAIATTLGLTSCVG